MCGEIQQPLVARGYGNFRHVQQQRLRGKKKKKEEHKRLAVKH